MAVSFDTSRLLSEVELERQEDWRELSQTRSVRIQDMILTVRNAIEDAREQVAQARAQAEAAAAQARAAAEQANAMAEQARRDAEAALAQAVTAAESAQQAAAQAQALLDEASASASAAASEAATVAQEALDEANAMLAQARETIEGLMRLPVHVALDAELEARLNAVFPDLLAGEDVLQSAQRGAQERATVLIPADIVEGEIDDSALSAITQGAAGEANELRALLEAARANGQIPAELTQQVERITAALAQADVFEAAGHTQVAAQLRAAWEPIAGALLEELGLLTTAGTSGSSTNVTTSTVANTDPGDAGTTASSSTTNTTTDTTTNTTTNTTTDTTPVTLPPVAVLPANDYTSVVGNGEPIGGGFYGVGDNGRTGQDSIYEWLPRVVAEAAAASTHGHYLLASSDQVTTVQQHLLDHAVYPITTGEERWDENGPTGLTTTMVSREAAIAHLAESGMSADEITAWLTEHESFMVHPGFSDESGTTGPSYVGRAEYLAAIGLPADVPLDLQIAFNNSGSGGGDAWLDRTSGDFDVQESSGVRQAYHAVIDDTLARDWVQIGDIGPLGDDVGKMLGDIYEQYGATTPEMQEIIRSVLFRYDERFGIIANREFIEAAVETNNARRQGFFEGPVGRAILMVVVSFIPGLNAAGVAAMQAALSAAFVAHDGGTFQDMVRAALASYVGAQVGTFVGTAVNGALQGSVNAAIAAGITGAVSAATISAVSQLIQTGRISGDSLIAAAISGGAGGMVTNLVSGTDWARGLDQALGLNPGTIARFIGGQAGSLASGQGLSASSAISSLAGGLVTGSTERVEAGEVLEGISALLPRLSDADLAALEEANLGLGENTSILDRPPAGADFDIGSSNGSVLSDADISAAELERMGYTRNAQTGLETWRNPETGQIVYMRSADGATLSVADGRSVLRDPNGVVLSVDGGAFGQAFAQARASGASTFLWNGASYSTITREDVLRSSGGDVNDYRAFVARTGDHSLQGYMADRADRAWAATPNPADRQFWESRGFSPDQVASFYVTSGNEHRLIQLAAQYEQTGSVPANGVSSLGMASTIASNLGQLPAGVQALYGIAVQGLSNYMSSLSANGQTMSPFETFGAVCAAAANRLAGTAQNIRDNTSGPGEATVVVTGALLHAAWEGTGGALQRAYATMTNPNATPAQVALATFEFMGAVASVAGAAVIMRGATTGATISATGLNQAGTAGALTIADAAGIILPSRPGGLSHLDLTPNGASNVPGGHLSPDLAGLQSRIDNIDLTAYEQRLIANYNHAVANSNTVVLTPETRGVPDGWAQSQYGDMWLGFRQDYVNFTRFGEDPTGLTTVRTLPDGRVVITNNAPNGNVTGPPDPNTLPFDVTQLDIRANAVVRHEYQHLLDFRAAAENPASPNLLRIPLDGASSTNRYSNFSFMELNGFRITAEEFSRAYVYAAHVGDHAAAEAIVNQYRTILGTFDNLLGATSNMLNAALTPQSQVLMRQSMTVSNTLPSNNGFVVVEFSIVGPDGLPRTMQAQIPEHTPPSVMVDAVNLQLRSGLSQLGPYATIGEAARRDFSAIEADFRRRFPGG